MTQAAHNQIVSLQVIWDQQHTDHSLDVKMRVLI